MGGVGGVGVELHIDERLGIGEFFLKWSRSKHPIENSVHE